MESRERVFTALEHKEPDRVPIDFWMAPEALAKLQKHFGIVGKDEVLDRIDADIRYIEGPRYIGPELKTHADGSEDDIWGVARKSVKVGEGDKRGTYMNVMRSPLQEIAGVDEAQAYAHWPSVDWYDFSTIEEQCDRYLKAGRVVAFVGDRTNRVAQLKPYMYIRGVENAFMDMALNRELFQFIVDRIREFYREYLARMLEASKGKIDIFLTGDDFGSQNGLLCSPDDWSSLLAPGFRDFMGIIKESGARAMHHTCGSVVPIIPAMVDAGLDILQSLQPEASGMGGKALKEQFGNDISFAGSISVQRNLPFGTPENVSAEVLERVATFAAGGGFIIGTAHNIQADVPVENILALLDAYKECLWY